MIKFLKQFDYVFIVIIIGLIIMFIYSNKKILEGFGELIPVKLLDIKLDSPLYRAGIDGIKPYKYIFLKNELKNNIYIGEISNINKERTELTLMTNEYVDYNKKDKQIIIKDTKFPLSDDVYIFAHNDPKIFYRPDAVNTTTTTTTKLPETTTTAKVIEVIPPAKELCNEWINAPSTKLCKGEGGDLPPGTYVKNNTSFSKCRSGPKDTKGNTINHVYNNSDMIDACVKNTSKYRTRDNKIYDNLYECAKQHYNYDFDKKDKDYGTGSQDTKIEKMVYNNCIAIDDKVAKSLEPKKYKGGPYIYPNLYECARQFVGYEYNTNKKGWAPQSTEENVENSCFPISDFNCDCEQWDKDDYLKGRKYCDIESKYDKNINGSAYVKGESKCKESCEKLKVADKEFCFTKEDDSKLDFNNMTCQELSDKYNADEKNLQRIHPKGRDVWKQKKCKTKPFSEMTCQEMSNIYDVVAGKSFGSLPGKGQEKWKKMNCKTEPNKPGVIFYRDSNFNGPLNKEYLKEGEYTLNKLNELGVTNDTVSSLKINGDYIVTIYEHDNYKGRSKEFTESSNWVGHDFNDILSSIKIKQYIPPGVTFYKDANFKVQMGKALPEGKYNLVELQKMGIQNDAISSLKINGDLMVTLYEHDFTGRSKTFYKDSNWVGNDFNDLTSSVSITKKNKADPQYFGGYIYKTREEAEKACKDKGYKGLAYKYQLEGKDRCSSGWTKDWKGWWVANKRQGCGNAGYNPHWDDGPVGAYCSDNEKPPPPSPESSQCESLNLRHKQQFGGNPNWKPGNFETGNALGSGWKNVGGVWKCPPTSCYSKDGKWKSPQGNIVNVQCNLPENQKPQQGKSPAVKKAEQWYVDKTQYNNNQYNNHKNNWINWSRLIAPQGKIHRDYMNKVNKVSPSIKQAWLVSYRRIANYDNQQRQKQRQCIGSQTCTQIKRNDTTKIVTVGELKLGDKVKSITKNGQLKWSPIYYIRDHGYTQCKHLNISFLDGSNVILSDNHLIYNQHKKLVRADTLNINDICYSHNSKYNKIIDITEIQDIPLTPCCLEGNILVGNNNILVSCWSNSKENADKLNNFKIVAEYLLENVTLETCSKICHYCYDTYKELNQNISPNIAFQKLNEKLKEFNGFDRQHLLKLLQDNFL